MDWSLTYCHKSPKLIPLGSPGFSIDEYIEFFFNSKYIGHILFYCLNSEVLTISRLYLTPNYRGKNFVRPMINILGDLYCSIKKIEIFITENLQKYREVEFHYNKLGFKKDTESIEKYFNIRGENYRIFKMEKLLNK
jgi:hypothetical protein